MAIYSLSLRTTSATSNQATWELQTSSKKAEILEIGYAVQSAGGRSLGLGRPTSLGVGMTSVTFLAEDFASPASTVTASITGWTLPFPGVPNNFLRRFSTFLNTSAGMVIWRFPEGLVVPANSNLAIFNLGTAFAEDIWCVINE
jgi:hypothetical protein